MGLLRQLRQGSDSSGDVVFVSPAWCQKQVAHGIVISLASEKLAQDLRQLREAGKVEDDGGGRHGVKDERGVGGDGGRGGGDGGSGDRPGLRRYGARQAKSELIVDVPLDVGEDGR